MEAVGYNAATPRWRLETLLGPANIQTVLVAATVVGLIMTVVSVAHKASITPVNGGRYPLPQTIVVRVSQANTRQKSSAC